MSAHVCACVCVSEYYGDAAGTSDLTVIGVCVRVRACVCVCVCVLVHVCVRVHVSVRVFGQAVGSQAKEIVSTLNPILTLLPIPIYCSVQTAVKRSTPIRGQRVYKHLTNWGLLRGSTWINQGLGRLSRHCDECHVHGCIRLQPGPVKVGRVSRH